MNNHPNMHLSPKQIVDRFKKVLKEAAQIYGKEPQQINIHEFSYVSGGRLGVGLISRCGGYAKLKAYVTGNKQQTLDTATIKMLERILSK